MDLLVLLIHLTMVTLLMPARISTANDYSNHPFDADSIIIFIAPFSTSTRAAIHQELASDKEGLNSFFMG